MLNICRIYLFNALFSVKIDENCHKTHQNPLDGAAISAQQPQDKFQKFVFLRIITHYYINNNCKILQVGRVQQGLGVLRLLVTDHCAI